MMKRIPFVCLICSLLIIGICVVAREATAQTSRYGCYQVTTGALNLRKRAWARSDVVGVVYRGNIVAKRRRFCALRGFWCPVRTKAGINGWADKKFLKKVACKA
ncbi:MAG: SH3 domain-containing protein [Hyphomicrobiaceae bacterium]